MKQLLLVAILLVPAGTAAAQDNIEVTLKNGKVYRGKLIEFDKTGGVRVRIDGKIQTFEQDSVATFRLTDIPVPEVTPVSPAQRRASDIEWAQERIRTLLNKGDYGAAIEESEKLLESLRARRQTAKNILVTALQRDLHASLAADRATEVITSLSRGAQYMDEQNLEVIFNMLMARVETSVQQRPAHAFTQHLLLLLATEVAGNKRFTESQRQRVRAQMESLADGLETALQYTDAESVLRRTVELFPKQRAALTPEIIRIQLAYGRRLLDEKKYDVARRELARLVKEFPGNKSGRTLYDTALLEETLARADVASFEDALRILRGFVNQAMGATGTPQVRQREFSMIRAYLNRASIPEGISVLNEYLSQKLPEKYRSWATQELIRFESFAAVQPPPMEPEVTRKIQDKAVATLNTYYPHAVGSRWVYRRTGDKSLVTIWIESVEDDEGITRVRSVTEQPNPQGRPYLGYSDTMIHGTEVYREREGTKEVLLKFPTKRADSWGWAASNLIFTRKIVSMHASVITPAGVLKDCIEIEFSSKSGAEGASYTITSRMYYAPNIGLVKQVLEDPKYQDQSLELTKYTPAGGPSKENGKPDGRKPTDPNRKYTERGTLRPARVVEDDD